MAPSRRRCVFARACKTAARGGKQIHRNRRSSEEEGEKEEEEMEWQVAEVDQEEIEEEKLEDEEEQAG